MAGPDLELKGGGGGVICRLLRRLFFLLQFFLPKTRGGPGPPDPSLRGREGSLHGENLQIQKALREVEADLALANEDKDRLNDELQEYYKKSSELQASYKICDQERMDNHQQVLMLTKKVERWEADLAEALTENKWLEAELENYTGNDRKNVEEVDIVKTQLVEVQSIMDDYRREGADKESTIEQLREQNLFLTRDYNDLKGELEYKKSLVNEIEKKKRTIQNKFPRLARGLCKSAERKNTENY